MKNLKKSRFVRKYWIVRKPNLAPWFWGGIILMAGLSILLSLAAVLRTNIDWNEPENVASSEDGFRTEANSEKSAYELKNMLDEATKVSLTAVKSQIGPLLNDAYQPVYASVPAYADFHYSVWGEYAELTEAALGDVSGKLQEMLFSGLEARLNSIGTELDSIFNSEFYKELETNTPTSDGAEFNPGTLTQLAVQGAVARMQVTVPVGTAVALGAGAAIKAGAAAITKKIAAKLAVKAAAKTGGKWVASTTAAGTGAALCSWTGPGAVICAAAGGIGAWIVTDYGIIKLDELWTRDKFEADLRAMIDEQKAIHRAAIEKATAARAAEIQIDAGEIVQQHDVALRELYGDGNKKICEITADFTRRYELISKHLGQRQPKAIQAFHNAMAPHFESLTLGPMVEEIERNLNQYSQVEVSAMRITGNFPEGYRSDRDISGLVYLNQTSLDIPKSKAVEQKGFTAELSGEITLLVDQPLNYIAAIKQHRGLLPSRIFGGVEKVRLVEVIDTSAGLEKIVILPLQIAPVWESGNEITHVETGGTVNLQVKLHAKPLAELKKVPDCR